jgi:hypothetical protein
MNWKILLILAVVLRRLRLPTKQTPNSSNRWYVLWQLVPSKIVPVSLVVRYHPLSSQTCVTNSFSR